ncbi:hypothetical protein Q4526_08020 [Gilvimarinus sp. 2_MG-2023]|nr:hypothetical protein [Gilvimarinus sp. 2_MG-2023]MDO6570878.1 hypothetical protein [Gilvimarinus sp. 2_MG-2023]
MPELILVAVTPGTGGNPDKPIISAKAMLSQEKQNKAADPAQN